MLGLNRNERLFDGILRLFLTTGPLGLHFNISQGRHAEVDAFLVKGGELMQAQAGRRVHIGDHLLAINGMLCALVLSISLGSLRGLKLY